MKPTTRELTGITAIAAVFCAIALVAAFAGAGVTAFAILAVVVGPASILIHRALSHHHRERAPDTDAASQPHPG